MKQISKFLYQKDEDGDTYAIPNPEYEKHLLKTKYQLHLQCSLIPTYYWEIEFENYQGDKTTPNYKKILHYAQNLKLEKYKNVNLYLHGPSSTQKTALAVNILKEGIKQGYKVRFVLAGVLIDTLMKIQGFKFDLDIDNFIKDLKSADLLVIDDAFDVNKTLMWKNSDNKNIIISEWDTFLRSFLSSNSRIIFTSNFAPEVIKQYFGDSLFQLIDRNCVALQLNDSIKDYKKEKLSDVFKEIK
jgi:DNA replication protein DnaC